MESIKTTEELLSLYPNWSYIRTDRNKTRYFSDSTCPRCGGRGIIDAYAYIDGGKCYECGGSGHTSHSTIIKVYTPEHAAKLAAQREARAKKAEEERRAKAIMERSAKLEHLGFGVENGEWVIYRVVGNTYPIKDELKAKGFHFNPVVGWYSGAPYDEHQCQRMTEDEVLTDSVFIEWKDKEDISPILYDNIHKEKDPSEWQGEVGARLEICAKVEKIISFDGRFGVTNLHMLRDDRGNVYKWSTQKSLEEGKEYILRATIKDHEEYKGVKQTVITRASVVKGEQYVDFLYGMRSLWIG